MRGYSPQLPYYRLETAIKVTNEGILPLILPYYRSGRAF